jgi:hypothetical protein
VANNLVRASAQLNGTLRDAGGVLVPDEAVAGPLAGGAYEAETINFEKEASPFDLVDGDGNTLASFSPGLFPGIPGTAGSVDKFATEVIGFVQLPAGVTTFGVSVGTDRTDVNDDDAYVVYVGKNPRSVFNQKVGEFERFAPPFSSNTKNENLFSVDAPQAGLYPFRLIYWQNSRGANLQWYTVLDSTERLLLNDPNDARALPVYRNSTVADANGPYIAEVSPAPGSDGNSASAPVTALIVDGAATVATSAVKLTFNSALVTPQSLTKTGNRISLSYDPNASRPNVNNTVALEYTDSAAVVRTGNWSFGSLATGGSATQVTGQWDFESGDLSATVGKALAYFNGKSGTDRFGEPFETKFGTTTALGVPDINGQVAKVMEVPGNLDRNIGYVVDHGIKPNGGGTRVNQYTLIMDVYLDTSGPGAASLWQTSSLNNTDDGDLFWQGSNIGQGGGDGYAGRGTFTAGAWHRVVVAYDEAATPPLVAKFVDGIKQDDWLDNQGLDAPRRTLQPTAILFGDGDQDERRKMWVNSVQIRSGRVTDAEAVALGGPSAAGIPQVIPASSVTGQWDFDYKDLGPSVGKALEYFNGATGVDRFGAEFAYAYGTTTELGVANIGGKEAKIIEIPGNVDRSIGLIMDHGIKPNGGGTRVNQYTLIMDVLLDTTGPGAASLWQTSSLNNTDDGDLFWQGSNIGQGGGDGYAGRGTFTAGEWHRVVVAYDEAATPPLVAKFVDGIKQDDWMDNQGLDAVRRTLLPTAILFADGDQDERRKLWVNAVQIRAGKLSDAQIVLLGGPSADGIPVVIPESTVTGQWDFDYKDLGPSVGKALQYFNGATGVDRFGVEFAYAYGTTTELGVENIDGQEAKVIEIPGNLDRSIGLIMDHGIKPNGGGTRVNQYTLIMDLFLDTSGPGAASLLQTSSLANTDDGDLFWQGNNFGQGGGDGYAGKGTFTAGAWHRVVAAYDEAAKPPVVVKYVDGIYQDDWTDNQGLDAVRRAMQPTALLFADGDQDERRKMWVNSVQVRAGRLSNAEIESLGGPTASGIPVRLAVAPPTVPPTLSIVRTGTSVTVSWPVAETGFTLESNATLGSAGWATVAGVANNSVTLPAGTGNLYLRLRK